jgi:hypothetical protein
MMYCSRGLAAGCRLLLVGGWACPRARALPEDSSGLLTQHCARRTLLLDNRSTEQPDKLQPTAQSSAHPYAQLLGFVLHCYGRELRSMETFGALLLNTAASALKGLVTHITQMITAIHKEWTHL